MVILIIKLIVVFILYNIIFVQISVTAETKDQSKQSYYSKTGFNFQEVVRANKQYSPIPDNCHLRIVGGVKASIEEVPYQVALRLAQRGGRVWSAFCGGAIITDRHVMSAAHCFGNRRLLPYTRVVAGTSISNVNLPRSRHLRQKAIQRIQSRESWRTIEKCLQHAQYSRRRSLRNDLAILFLERPFSFSARVKPILMSSQHTPDKTPCLVSGFGHMENGKRTPDLRKVCVPVVPNRVCKRSFRQVSPYFQICAGTWHKDSCSGDSGGPLVCKGVLVGIVSYGSRKCGSAPGVYTLVSAYTRSNRVPFRRCASVKMKYNAFVMIPTLTVFFVYFMNYRFLYM